MRLSLVNYSVVWHCNFNVAFAPPLLNGNSHVLNTELRNSPYIDRSVVVHALLFPRIQTALSPYSNLYLMKFHIQPDWAIPYMYIWSTCYTFLLDVLSACCENQVFFQLKTDPVCGFSQTFVHTLSFEIYLGNIYWLNFWTWLLFSISARKALLQGK